MHKPKEYSLPAEYAEKRKRIAEILANTDEGETVIINGERYQKEDAGYTIRQYFSHSTPEKGPGPGWDGRWSTLKEYGVKEASDLPDEPYYLLTRIEEDING